MSRVNFDKQYQGIKVNEQTDDTFVNIGKSFRYVDSELFARRYILSETSKPPLDNSIYILTYMIHTWLQFTLNKE